MTEIRLNKIIKQFNIGLSDLVEFLQRIGVEVDKNPNAKISDYYLPAIEKQFGGDREAMAASEKADITISQILTREKVKAETKRKSLNPSRGLDWDFFSAEEPQKGPAIEDVASDSPESDTPEWELKLKEVINEIPGPLSEEAKKAILQKVAKFLESPTEPTDRKEQDSRNELLGDVISAVTTRNESKLIKLFDVINGRDIASRREITTELIKDGHIVGENFWFFVNFLLTLNATLYKKPIVDGTQHISDFHQYIPDDQNIIIRTSELLFKDKEKIHQAIPFFYFYRKRLPAVVRQDIMDNFHYLTDLNDINYVFETLGSNTNEQLYLLSTNNSVASMYLGTMLLYNYKNAYGKEAVEGIQSFRLFYSELSGDMDTPSGLARAIISKLVLEDNYQMTADEAKAYINGGLESFNAFFEQKRKADVKAKLKRDITLLDGTELSFSLVSKAKQGYLVRVHGNSYAAILPYRFATEEIKSGTVYRARVVKTSKHPLFILLSQKNTQRYEINSFSLVNVGDVVDCRFSLYEDRIAPDIVGAGPIYGTLVNIPRNFDYKRKHKVRVTKVTGMASCEIEVISEE